MLQSKIEQEQELQAKLKALFNISIELTQIDRLDDLYRRVVELAVESLGFERFGLLLLDKDKAKGVGTYGTNTSGQVVSEHSLEIDPANLTGILKRSLDTR